MWESRGAPAASSERHRDRLPFQNEEFTGRLPEADILVVAIGKAKFVTADMVRDGAVVIDVGVESFGQWDSSSAMLILARSARRPAGSPRPRRRGTNDDCDVAGQYHSNLLREWRDDCKQGRYS